MLSTVFTYAQFVLAIAAAFFVTPLILHTVGARQYGVWLSTGELIGYFLLLDFGVFSVMPWLIARADGRKDLDELKRVMALGLAVALILAAALLIGVFALWGKLPALLHLSAGDWHALAGPLGLLVILLAVNLPLNILNPLLVGLQDVRFCGVINLLKALLCPALTVVLLLTGHGLYALAIGTALLAPLGGIAAFFRIKKIAPDRLRAWPRPTPRGAMGLFRESIGGWLGGAGVQMIERSSALVLTFLGHPAMVPTLYCTSRLSQILTQMAWVMPDSALVGFAQLGGENNPARLREVALSIIRLNLVVAAGAACLVLALNPAFVRIWVGQEFFGGLPLNLLLAAKVIGGSLSHAFATVVAVQGNRLAIGLGTLAQGAIFLALALPLARQFSLEGLLMADLLAPLLSTLPVSVWLLRSSLGIRLGHLVSELGPPLLLRAAPCLLLAWIYGFYRAPGAWLLELAAAGLLVAFVYLHAMAPQLATFPLPAGAHVWLQRLRLVRA